MQAVARSLLLLLLLAACARISALPQERPAGMTAGAIAELEANFILWEPCNRTEAEQWAVEAETNVRQALKGASCYAFLLKEETDRTVQLEDAKRGRNLAEAAVQKAPQSGLGHYLAAMLTGLQAERNPLDGLNAVPIIEKEARIAARLSPDLDHGGPDRMLGELYLRAPGPPISIGDSNKAVIHYRRAIKHAPHHLDNRLGLVESLLVEEEPDAACEELAAVLAEMPPAAAHQAQWQKALTLLKRFCGMQGDH